MTEAAGAGAPGPQSQGGGTGPRILGNFLYLLLAQAVTTGAGVVSTAFLARRLGTEAYGILGFGTALLSYFGLLVVFGSDVWGMREIAQDRAGAPRLVRRLLGLRTVLVAAVWILYVVVVAALDVPERVRTVLWIQGFGLFVTACSLDFVFQALQRMGMLAVRQSMAALITLGAVLALIRSPADVYIAAAIPVAAIALSVLWMGTRIHREVAPFVPAFAPSAWRAMLKGAFPIAVAQFMSAVFFQLDIVMLGFLASEHEVGLYVGMSRVQLIAVMFGNLVGAAFTPALAEAWPDEARMRARFRDFTIAVMFVGAPVAAVGMAFPGEIIAIVFGDAFLGGATALVILMAMALFASASVAASAALVSWHDQTAYMFAFGAGGVANAALNLILIPRYGIEGAAVATLAAQLVVLAGVVGRVRFRFRLWPPANAVLLTGCAAVAFGAVRGGEIAFGAPLVAGPVVVRFAAEVAAGGLIYLALALASRAVAPRRLMAIVGERLRRPG